MTKRKKKKSPRAARKALVANLKIYIGIILILALIGVLAAVSAKFASKAHKMPEKTIEKIENYLNTNSTQNRKSVLDVNSDEKPIKIEPKPKSVGKNLDVNLSELLGIDENISTPHADENLSVKEKNASKDVNSSKKDLSNKRKKNAEFTREKSEFAIITPKKSNPKEPKLVIIIDDVSSYEQVKNIKATGLKITPSIFPSTKSHPKSAYLAREFEFFMVHLPLEALYFRANEENTLTINSTQSEIDERISAVKRQFPGVKYLNNHTGSKFTSNYKSTKMLLNTLKSNDIRFLDSLTTSSSQVPKVCKELGLSYVYRDVFLDNDENIAKILAQLENAVNIAKKNGHAIAIGHPYKATFRALNIAKNKILKDVQIVYLRDIYGFY